MKIKNANSSIKKSRIIEKEIDNKKLFTMIPKILEKPMSPWRYSFFKGIKKVLKSKGTDKSEERYLLNSVKILKIEPTTSLYQKMNRYTG